jgi:hypothetical protein
MSHPMKHLVRLLAIFIVGMYPLAAHPDPDATQIASPTVCAAAESQDDFLATHNFRPVAASALGAIHRLQLWINDEGAWVLVLANRRGVACILAFGRHWEGAEATQ